MNMDILHEYVQGYIWISKDIFGYLDCISFLGYDLHSCPNFQKISCHILTYPCISLHILLYPKISSGANSQMLYEVAPPPVGPTWTTGRTRAAEATRRHMHI
jgi:hypothetical protein